MKTIHDEEKIKEILTAGTEQAGDFHHSANVIPTHVAEMLIKQYAEHTRLKTIDEAIGCVRNSTELEYTEKPIPCPDNIPGCLVYHFEHIPVYSATANKIITNLEQLKK